MTPLPIRLHINGQPVSAQVEPRMLLGDFLRDDCRLTGLHLACEHGVCGACNVEINGSLSRSCTQLAVRCDEQQVRTIEGFGDDALMARLRAAFSAEHALQCGYCTPGMLMTARDIVHRFPTADEAVVRRELSGNLCRCTGYAGIVRAILRVVGERGDWSVAAAPPPVAARANALTAVAPTEHAPTPPRADQELEAGDDRIPDPMPVPTEGMGTIARSFTLPATREQVWQLFSDVTSVAACMPGLAVEAVQDNERLRGTFTVKAGPIRAVFATIARITRDQPAWSGRVESEGRDRFTRSTTLAQLDYGLRPAEGGAGTDIEIRAAFHIEGRLAEFSRPEVVAALASQLTESFAANVERRLVHGAAAAPARALELSLAGVLRSWLEPLRRAVAGLVRRIASRR